MTDAVRTALAATLLLTCGPALAQEPAPSRALPFAPVVPRPPLAGPAPPSPGVGAPIRVTTDTPEYCEQLSQRVMHAEHLLRAIAPASSSVQPPAIARLDRRSEVEELAAEGHDMCATGLIRGGLLRLRRAWMLLRAEK